MEMEAVNNPVNAEEPWILYDTVQIREPSKEFPIPNGNGFPNLAALAAAQSVNLFNVRAIGDPGVGEAYNNLDSRDSMPFAFVLRTFGLTFQSPRALVMKPDFDQTGNLIGQNGALCALWEQEMVRHVGVHLKISQDEKLLAASMFCPEGTGLSGFGIAGPTVGAYGATAPIGAASFATGAAQVGVDHLSNRWTWPRGVNVPKGCNLSVQLVFSEYGKALLKLFGGTPVEYDFATGDIVTPVKHFPGMFSIRASLIGTRLVQQRNELHV
jgi:hypothetical protein